RSQHGDVAAPRRRLQRQFEAQSLLRAVRPMRPIARKLIVVPAPTSTLFGPDALDAEHRIVWPQPDPNRVLEKITQRLAQMVGTVWCLFRLLQDDGFQQFRRSTSDAAVAMLVTEAVQKRTPLRLRVLRFQRQHQFEVTDDQRTDRARNGARGT